MTTYILHIGKTGGNSLRHVLQPLEQQFGIQVLRHRSTLKDVGPGDRAIFTVREPVSRFISGFNSRLRQGRPRNDVPWKGGEIETFARFKAPNELAEALSSPADRAAAEAAMGSIQHVREHLSHWLGSLDYLRSRQNDIAYVCHQPELTQDFEAIKRLLGLPEELALPEDPIIAHHTPEGFSTSLSALGEANIRAWYADDFLLYEECLKLREKKRAAIAQLAG